jgi:pilus assembly protein CpaC
MTKQRANKDVARRPAKLAVAAAAAAALSLFLTVGRSGGQDVGTGPGQPQGPTPGQPYPNAAPGQPYPAQPAGGGAGGAIPVPAPAPGASAPVAAADQSPTPVEPGSPATTRPTNGPATQPSAAPAAPTDSTVRVDAGRTIVLRLPRAALTVSVADSSIASVKMMPVDETHSDPRTVLINGKKGGTTTLVVLDDMRRTTIYDLAVAPDFTALRAQLKEQFPGLPVTATPLGDTISLRGMVPNDKVAAQVNEVAGTFAKVHNFLEIAGGQQVMLQIRFAEVDRSAVRQLGVNFGGTDSVSSFANNIGQVNPLGFITSGTSINGVGLGAVTGGSAVQLFGQGQFGRTAFAYFVQALEENGLVRMLAEPNVVAINGQEASFIAGGEFPVPVSQGGGSGAGAAVTVQYQEYGIKLNFTPLVLGNGQIRLKVAPEVSELDFSNAVTSNGFRIPALTKRKVSTTVELADGQSFALAGLMNDTTSATTNAVPLLGDIPILGMLFRSTQYQRQQSELVVLVTPRLVGPTDPDTTAALPGEHWRFPPDAGAYFNHDLGGNQLEPAKDGHKGADKSLEETVPPRAFHGTYGFTPNGAGSVGTAGEK